MWSHRRAERVSLGGLSVRNSNPPTLVGRLLSSTLYYLKSSRYSNGLAPFWGSIFRYRFAPQSWEATYLNRAQTSMSAEFPSGKQPTTRVRGRFRNGRSWSRECGRGGASGSGQAPLLPVSHHAAPEGDVGECDYHGLPGHEPRQDLSGSFVAHFSRAMEEAKVTLRLLSLIMAPKVNAWAV